jgi:hypothetical protein
VQPEPATEPLDQLLRAGRQQDAEVAGVEVVIEQEPGCRPDLGDQPLGHDVGHCQQGLAFHPRDHSQRLAPYPVDLGVAGATPCVERMLEPGPHQPPSGDELAGGELTDQRDDAGAGDQRPVEVEHGDMLESRTDGAPPLVSDLSGSGHDVTVPARGVHDAKDG